MIVVALALVLWSILMVGTGWHLRECAYAAQAALWDAAVRDGTIRTHASTRDGRDDHNLPQGRYEEDQ